MRCARLIGTELLTSDALINWRDIRRVERWVRKTHNALITFYGKRVCGQFDRDIVEIFQSISWVCLSICRVKLNYMNVDAKIEMRAWNTLLNKSKSWLWVRPALFAIDRNTCVMQYARQRQWRRFVPSNIGLVRLWMAYISCVHLMPE